MNKKLLVVYGSPHMKGNSATLADVFADEAGIQGDSVEKVYLQKENIHPCLGCDGCAKTHICVQKDGMQAILDKFVTADTVCIATSVYWWGITAQTKMFVDRLYALDSSIFKGKELYVIAVGEDSLDGIQYPLIDHQFKEIASFTKMEYRGFLPVSAGKGNPAKDNPEALESATKLFKK